MPCWNPIDLNDRVLIESYLRKKCYDISDLSFTNLFLWHFTRSISYKIKDNFLCIKTQYPNEEPFIFMPIGVGDLAGVIKDLAFEFERKLIPFSIRSVDNTMKKELEETLPSYFDFSPSRDRFDYIYYSKELIELKGRKFHKKKNHINRFRELYNFQYESFCKDNIIELIDRYKEWFGEISDTVSQGLKNEYIGIVEALKNFDSLSCKGGIIRVDGTIVAFSFGEAINDNMVVVHIEKADTSFHGAYQMINQQFIENEWSGYKYINREEDLGVEGLRRAKLSYQPCTLLEKYIATPKI